MDGTSFLIEKNVPEGKVAIVSTEFFKLIKQDDSFIKQGDIAQNIAIKGQVGMVDGIPIVVAPSTRLPAGVLFFITHKIATTSPVKLSEYKIHDNPPGINGWLVEGRVYYDAFVLDNKKNAIYVHKKAE